MDCVTFFQKCCNALTFPDFYNWQLENFQGFVLQEIEKYLYNIPDGEIIIRTRSEIFESSSSKGLEL